jgi:hypothetical protein
VLEAAVSVERWAHETLGVLRLSAPGIRRFTPPALGPSRLSPQKAPPSAVGAR